jgi:hypothetical protein
MSDNVNDLVELIAAARTMLVPKLDQYVGEQAERVVGSFRNLQAARIADATINLGCAVDAVRAGITVLFDRLAQDGVLDPKETGTCHCHQTAFAGCRQRFSGLG